MKSLLILLCNIIEFIIGAIVFSSLGLFLVIVLMLLAEAHFNIIEFLFRLLKLLPYGLILLVVVCLLLWITYFIARYKESLKED